MTDKIEAVFQLEGCRVGRFGSAVGGIALVPQRCYLWSRIKERDLIRVSLFHIQAVTGIKRGFSGLIAVFSVLMPVPVGPMFGRRKWF